MSNSTIIKTTDKPCVSIKTQTLATLLAIISAVVLPQIFHILGTVSGLGTIPGDVFLPMHLPIILVGFLAGPYAGAISGFLSPLVSFTLSGMPNIIILPFMMIELFAYGLSAGLIKNTKIPTIAKVFISQISGRVMFVLSILTSIYLLGNETISLVNVLNSLRGGIFGIIIQLLVFPLIIYRIENKK
ncbi:MAG: ECF transporter S component [Lachnospiraceae bacterium]|nr:ECF transporter S component [Lachnospiraceae bacterium]